MSNILKGLKKVDERRQESLQQEYYSELQESKFCPARTLKNYTQTVQQQF